MEKQAKGMLGWAVDRMIRRSVRKSFHTVFWLKPLYELPRPCILVANHHGWHDGYLMYLAATRLGLPVVDWIQEFDAFPPFGAIGGMPFPANDPFRRTQTIRRTIRLMRQSGTSLILFPEATLHRPDSLLPFGKALELVAAKVPGVTVVPVALRYELAMHERPEAYVSFGTPVPIGDRLASRARLEVASLLGRLRATIAFDSERLEVLATGTKDVNERMDMRWIPSRRQKEPRLRK
jgi:1-acyl-sn-glycerol-3-phosphate acyltransferase